MIQTYSASVTLNPKLQKSLVGHWWHNMSQVNNRAKTCVIDVCKDVQPV